MQQYGLSSAEAQAAKQQFGDNSLADKKTMSFASKFLASLTDPMIIILLVALAINVIFTLMGLSEWYESVGIALAVLLATVVSAYSEFRNESAFQKLQEEASRIVCKVYRDGQLAELSINDIVVGDALLLQTGDLVPADGTLLSGELSCDQSALNGESEEVRKCVAGEGYTPSEATNFDDPHKLYRGSIVYSGNAVLAVRAVGEASVYGQIAKELRTEEERDTPLKLKLRGLARGISRFGYIGGGLIAATFLFQGIFVAHGFEPEAIAAFCSNLPELGHLAIQAIMLAVIIIVMAVPEGLPLMIAIVSALNMGKMLKAGVLVRELAGIETAGSLNILFSDKTGTITKGQLETVAFIAGDGCEYESMQSIQPALRELLAVSLRFNTGAVITEEGGVARALGGNATERAVLAFALGASEPANREVVRSLPFSSTEKYSAAEVHSLKANDLGDLSNLNSPSMTLIKGAPEKILASCSHWYTNDGTRAVLDNPALIESRIDAFAKRAIRVLAVAVSSDPLTEDGLTQGGWTLVGILGIRDELRPESAPAIAEVQAAGVQVVMITGDRRETAVAVAQEAGLLAAPDSIVLNSDELARYTDDEVRELLPRLRVIARALPSDKSRLVRLAKDLNLVVGMTGDGVNDAPALKAADVGFAMGSGTEVAKEASEIIILDDNFSSIDRAILYGRTIFNSIRKFIVFQLTINISAVLICFIMPLLGQPTPLTITQILWVNLVMDTLAALAFGGEPALRRFMLEAPKRRDESIVSPSMWSAILTDSLFIFALSLFFLLGGVASGLFRADEAGIYFYTGYFAFFIIVAVLNAFNARTEQLNLFDNLRLNRGFINVMALIVVVQVIMTYLGGPILGGFGLMPEEWLFVLGLAVLIIPIDLLRKALIKLVTKV